MEATYQIPTHHLDKLLEQLERLNRRAKKLGVPAIAVSVDYDHPQDERVLVDEELETYAVVRRYSVSISGETPMLAGWKFIGTIIPMPDDDEGETHTFVMAVPGETVPEQYWSATQMCDECGLERQRRDTYIVYNSNADVPFPEGDPRRYKQVGSGCLSKFLGGLDPHAAAAAAEILEAAGALCESGADEDDGYEGPRGMRGREWIDTESFLTLTWAVCRTHGWLSRGKAREQDRVDGATANRVLDQLFDRMMPAEDRVRPTAEDRAQALAALAWARDVLPNRTPLSDYERNLVAALRTDVLPMEAAGVAASLYIAYVRYLEGERKRAERKPSEWVGTPGKREVFTVTVLLVIPRESEFGIQYLHILSDELGNKLIWKTGTESLQKGATYRGKATVKKAKRDKWGREFPDGHREYKGEKQTEISRFDWELVEPAPGSEAEAGEAETGEAGAGAGAAEMPGEWPAELCEPVVFVGGVDAAVAA